MNKISSVLLLIVLFSLSCIPFLWTRGDELLLGYDNVYPLRPREYIEDRLYSWTRSRGIEMDHSGMQGSVIIHFIDSVPQFLGFSPQNSQKIVFSFWFFLLLLSPYIFVRRLDRLGLLKSPYVRYFFPVLYAVNFYVLQAWWVVERTKFSLMVAMPLLLALVIETAYSAKTAKFVLKRALIGALILTVFNGGGWIGLPLFGGLLLVIGIAYLFFTIVFLFHRQTKRWLYLSTFFILMAFWYALFNAYTLLPFAGTTVRSYAKQLSDAGGVSGLLGWTNYLSVDTSITNLLQMQGIPDWYNSIDTHPYATYYLNNRILVGISFVFPALLFLSFLVIKKKLNRTLSIFFLILLLVSLIFTAGTHKPFGFIISFFLRSVPGFIIFRSLFFKFGYAYWFAAGFFIAIALSSGTEWLTSRFEKGRQKDLISFLAPLFVIILLTAYHFPYLTGDIFRIGNQAETERVVVPAYVDEFASWWSETDSTEKILLLPQLNADWSFEQYRWGYVSLTPLLSNYASSRIIENVEHATPYELNLLSALYTAINEQEFEQVDRFASVLGIRYFLVRNDFFHDFPDRLTDDPSLIAKNLEQHPRVHKLNTFGEWLVYGYAEEKPLIFASRSVAVTDDPVTYFQEEKILNSTVLLSSGEYINGVDNATAVYSKAGCLSCSAEQIETQIFFPSLKILPDSPLYDFILFKNRLQDKVPATIDDRMFKLVGDSLKLAAQVEGLIRKEAAERYIHASSEQYVKTLSAMSEIFPSLIEESPNPYKSAVIAQQYLEAERIFIQKMLENIQKQSVLITLEKMRGATVKTIQDLKSFYGVDDFNVKKYYTFNILSEGLYEVKLLKNSLGTAEEENSLITVSIDDTEPGMPVSSDENYLYFQPQPLSEGSHSLALYLPQQQSLLSDPADEMLAGRQCFSSYLNVYSKQKSYDLSIDEKNMNIEDFFLFIDHGGTFDPRLVFYFPRGGEPSEHHRFIVSGQTVALDSTADTLRIGFCASQLNAQLYEDTVQTLTLRELPVPSFTFRKQMALTEQAESPHITFQQINQTSYRAHVNESNGMFYLVLNERYAPGWTVENATHMMANNYSNVWRIDGQRDGDILISYAPQRYFFYGLIITALAVIAGIGTFVYLSRKERI